MHIKLSHLYLFISIVFLFIQNGCEEEKIHKKKKDIVIDSLALKDSSLIKKKPELKITYHKY